ncbi:MAG: hypothetical protein AAFQ82_05070 [Myxococcota bacterium]
MSRPDEFEIRQTMLAGIPEVLAGQGVSVESPVGALCDALQELKPSCLPYVPIASLLRHLEQRSPGYLRSMGQSRLEAISESRLLELITVLFEHHGVHPEASLEALLTCLRDKCLEPVRRDLQVLDLSLGFVTQSYQAL